MALNFSVHPGMGREVTFAKGDRVRVVAPRHRFTGMEGRVVTVWPQGAHPTVWVRLAGDVQPWPGIVGFWQTALLKLATPVAEGERGVPGV